MILQHGPRDPLEILRIMTLLKVKIEKADNVEDTNFYLSQLEAYEILRDYLRIQTTALPLS